MSAPTLRQRAKHVRKQSEDEEPAPILTEEEQDKVIEDLRRNNELSTTVNLWFVKIVIGLAILTHMKFLFDNSGRHPLSTFLPTFLANPQPLIPFARAFTLLHVGLLGYALALVTPSLPVKVPVMSQTVLFTLSNLAVAIAFFTRTTDFAQIFWWMNTTFILTGVQSTIKAVQDGELGLTQLEQLKYDAKGA